MIWSADNLAKLIFKQDGVPIPKHAAAAACARADHDPRSAGSVPCPRSKTWRRSCARSRRFRRSPRSIFNLGTVAGNQRKTSGSYYTPDSLVQCLLDSALDPVVEKAIKGKTVAEAEKAILALKVCDPAVGSGHFLVGAAHRLAKHLAQSRAQAQGESEPSPLYYQHALRDVIGRCLYGVDVNPMAAELCRVSLWLEAIEPGKPLSFLDPHIRVGNSLLGATPALLAKGIPDEAFTPIEGDDNKVCILPAIRRSARNPHGN